MLGIGALGWGIIAILLLTLLIGYVVVQETRAHRHWRGLVAAGDVDAIGRIVQDALAGWRAGRPPRGVPANIWSAVQTAQLVDTGADFARLSTGVESQYAMVDGDRTEVSSSFEEAAKVTRKLGDMMLYDIPDLTLPYVQIDVYSTFRDEQERPEQHCILSTIIERAKAPAFDWDEGTSDDLIATFECRYRLNDVGVALPIEPLSIESARQQPSGNGRTDIGT